MSHSVRPERYRVESVSAGALKRSLPGSPWLAAATTLLSAYLLFQVEPLVARELLPRFGGSAATWTTSMLFFQVGLLVGYAYAAFLARRLSPRGQLVVHSALLLASLLLLPVGPASSWRPEAGGAPQLQLLGILALTVGAPFVLLSATSPLIQSWVAVGSPGRSPYRLYAASNAGSLAGLLSYPFLVEPLLSLGRQSRVWSWGYALFSVLCVATAARQLARARAAPNPTPAAPSAAPLGAGTVWLWLGLAGAGTTLLFAVTNELTLNVAAVPFLWVLPLSLYLASFILCFESDRWYVRRFWFPAMAAGLVGITLVGARPGELSLTTQIVVYSLGLFACCMVCHGELARLRPDPARLTTFYLVLALGGALGGVFVSALAPFAFSDVFELPVGLGGALLLVLTAARRDASTPLSAIPRSRFRLIFGSLLVALAALPVLGAWKDRRAGVLSARNFYGTIKVRVERPVGLPARRVMAHGATRHGIQLLDPAHSRDGTGYYARNAGGGLAIASAPKHRPRRVGLIGLGVGTLATYGRPGDLYRFYEINPLVVKVARQRFSYLKDSPAEVQVVVDDARLALEREPPNHFDVLVADAFSGDSVPAHLLTVEAFRLYFRHLGDDSVLAVHASNHYLDLVSLVRATARSLGKASVVVRTQGNEAAGVLPAEWVLVADDPKRLEIPGLDATHAEPESFVTPWTDDYGSLFSIVR